MSFIDTCIFFSLRIDRSRNCKKSKIIFIISIKAQDDVLNSFSYKYILVFKVYLKKSALRIDKYFLPFNFKKPLD